jgi:hypothetical protein
MVNSERMVNSEVHISQFSRDYHFNDNFVQNQPIPTAHFRGFDPKSLLLPEWVTFVKFFTMKY